jgi:hypothetical protein
MVNESVVYFIELLNVLKKTTGKSTVSDRPMKTGVLIAKTFSETIKTRKEK